MKIPRFKNRLVSRKEVAMILCEEWKQQKQHKLDPGIQTIIHRAMREQEIKKDSVSLSALYKKRNELMERLAANPNDWTAKHLLQTVQDEIKEKRQDNYKKEQEKK